MIIKENGKYRWDNGPLCDTEVDALKTATVGQASDEQVFVMDSATTPSIDDDIFDMEDM
jgi:hypothetical protein